MSQVKNKNKKVFVKLGFEAEEKKGIVKALNALLANYNVHYQKLRKYHWNVVGSDFFDIHEKTEMLYNDAKLNIDEVAERIRVFGAKPMGNMSDYLENSEIKETTRDLPSDLMVKEILKDFEMLLSYMVDVVDEASSAGDTGTVDLMNTMMRDLEKHHWMLTSFLKEE